MIWGAGGMAASLAIIAGCLSTGESKGAIGATVFIFIYDTCFAIGWLGIGWVSSAFVAHNDMFLMECSFILPRSHHSVLVHRQMASVQ